MPHNDVDFGMSVVDHETGHSQRERTTVFFQWRSHDGVIDRCRFIWVAIHVRPRIGIPLFDAIVLFSSVRGNRIALFRIIVGEGVKDFKRGGREIDDVETAGWEFALA